MSSKMAAGRTSEPSGEPIGERVNRDGFGSDLSPAQPVRLRRLLLYWLITTGIAAICFSTPKINQITTEANRNFASRKIYRPSTTQPGYFNNPWGYQCTQADLDDMWPLPSQALFWRNQFTTSWQRSDEAELGLFWAMILLTWPWFSLLGLLVFRVSMRQAKILRVHLLRTVIYSCDFGFILSLVMIAGVSMRFQIADGWLAMAGAVVCAVFTTYRLTIAFRQYLRVHLPFATVLASQVISLLVVFLLLVQIADFSRRI